MQDIANILFLDIETVSAYPTFDEVPEVFQDLWRHKAESLVKKDEALSDEEVAASYIDRAAIYAEYGKIMCISVGAVYRDADKQLRVRLKSFAGDDERQILLDFSEMMNQYYQNPAKHGICGHNVKEFDVPYICRRMVVNQLPFPALLDLEGKKPWETMHLIDTMENVEIRRPQELYFAQDLSRSLGFSLPQRRH